MIKVSEAEAEAMEAEAEAIGWKRKRKRLKIVRFRIPALNILKIKTEDLEDFLLDIFFIYTLMTHLTKLSKSK